ncbi:DUF6438 domain-containing protein [Gallaecimonas sp. GXIMD1310]|uniref:DUF6438 domain-containing protein n=1 Tax=Gallaecimonas sp. GXIMD1310 TaxID=3131926 RepID=UPI00324540B6
MKTSGTLIFLACFVFGYGAQAQEPSAGSRAQVIQLQRTTCFGKCPSYIITVFENGEFIWEGRKYVKRRGLYTGHGESSAFKRALALLEKAKIKDFKDYYVYGKSDGCKEDWTDNPSIRILVQTKKYTKEIRHNTGCRGFDREKDLLSLEDELDKIFVTERWVGENR